jgi:hypothetical protein
MSILLILEEIIFLIFLRKDNGPIDLNSAAGEFNKWTPLKSTKNYFILISCYYSLWEEVSKLLNDFYFNTMLINL